MPVIPDHYVKHCVRPALVSKFTLENENTRLPLALGVVI